MAGSLLNKIKKGKNIYGTCIVSTSPIWSKSLKNTGLDYVFLDTEHIPLDRTELTGLCQVYTAMGISPIVRIPSPDPYIACMVKDAGAVGVIAPYIENAEQIRQLVGATKYRPLKGERLQKVLKGEEDLEPELMAYLKKYNDGSITIVNIESRSAVNNLDELLNVNGLDAIIIGPHDLSINIGIPEQYEHPEFEKVVKQIIQKSRSKGIAVGIHFPDNPKRQIKWMNEGVNMIMHSSDMLLFHQKLKADMNKIKQAAGDDIITSEDADLAI